mmetsp:Transcript_28630/g.91316  ORF Transcript_28630/g.91316 Transcript_28630/m.91316 type:complete len:570 (+) Transcript_28630:973-2682(+)
MLHTLQCQHQKRYRDNEVCMRLQLSAHKTFSEAVKVVGGSTLEVALAQFWSSHSETALDLEVAFHGLTPSESHVHVDSAAGAARVMIKSPFRSEKALPKATVDALQTPLRPKDAKVSPLPDGRDHLPDGRQIRQLVLSYEFSLEADAKVTPLLPELNGRVYDGTVEQQFFQILDSNKRVVAQGDIYPRDATESLKKGDYTVRVQIRHDDESLLFKMKDMPLVLERALKDPITLPVYTSVDQAARRGAEAKEAVLSAGASVSYWVGPPGADSLPSDGKLGSTLSGKVTWGKLSPTCGAAKGCPAASTLSCSVVPKGKAKETEVKDEADKLPVKERASEAVRDAKVKLLGDLAKDTSEEGRGDWEALRAELESEYPAHLPLLSSVLATLDKAPAKEEGGDKAKRLERVVAAADKLVAAVDPLPLYQLVARKCEPEEPGSTKETKDLEAQKKALAEGLKCKAVALLDLEELQPPAAAAPEEEDTFEAAFAALRVWADTEDAPHALLHARRERRKGRPCLALKALMGLEGSDKYTKEVAELSAALMRDLGWGHCAERELGSVADRFPAAEPLF